MTEPNPPRARKGPNTALAHWIGVAGLSWGQVATELRRVALANGRPEMIRDRTRVGHWVSDGEVPKPPIPDYLAQILTFKSNRSTPLTPADIGMSPRGNHTGSTDGTPAPPAPDQAGDPTKRRTTFSLPVAALAAGIPTADTARAYTQHAVRTDLRPGDLEDLDLAVHQTGATYSATSPRQLLPVVAGYRKTAFLLATEKRHTLKEGRELAHHAGMLSVILAWLAHDLGDKDLVEAFCEDAWVQATQAGDPQVGAWAEDVRATEALYDGRPLDALTAATRGLAVAARDGDAAVRLSAQQARAHARVGDRAGFCAADHRLNHIKDRLPLSSSGLFATDAVRLVSYEATSWGWLGDPAKSREAAAQAISHYEAMSGPYQAPTRLAIAHLDLALAHVAIGEPEAAVAAARPALTGGRLVQSIRGRVSQLERRLQMRYPALPATEEFSEAVSFLAV